MLFLLAGCTPDSPPLDALEPGNQTVDVDGTPRNVRVFLPADTAGAPTLFAFHFLFGTPALLLDQLEVDTLTDDGFIVLVPRSRSLTGTEWDLENAPASNPDVALFDVLRDEALILGGDPERMYATGFSAGGLFTSYLTMNRADVLAATAPFSGGTLPTTYVTPATDLPVMLTWGGPDDEVFGFDFHAANQVFADALRADGNPVVTCEHAGGHVVPARGTAQVREFLLGHAESGAVAVPTGCDG